MCYNNYNCTLYFAVFILFYLRFRKALRSKVKIIFLNLYLLQNNSSFLSIVHTNFFCLLTFLKQMMFSILKYTANKTLKITNS